jgi:hypothetical protein
MAQFLCSEKAQKLLLIFIMLTGVGMRLMHPKRIIATSVNANKKPRHEIGAQGATIAKFL